MSLTRRCQAAFFVLVFTEVVKGGSFLDHGFDEKMLGAK
jgi:hypothetical protein